MKPRKQRRMDPKEMMVREVEKNFDGKMYKGKIVDVVYCSFPGWKKQNWWRVLNEDGDQEDFSRDQVIQHMTRSAKEKWLDEDSDNSQPTLLGSSEEDIPPD